MKKKALVVLLYLASAGLAVGEQSRKIGEKELVIQRQETYKLYRENYGKLGHCTTRRSEARGRSIYFPENRSDIIVMYEGGIYLAAQVRNKKIKLLWSLCDSRSGKEKPLKKSQYKSRLWKSIAGNYKIGVQYGKFPNIRGGYDMFYANWDTGEAVRIDKNGRTVCSYENVVAEQGFEAKPKITKLCKP